MKNDNFFTLYSGLSLKGILWAAPVSGVVFLENTITAPLKISNEGF